MFFHFKIHFQIHFQIKKLLGFSALLLITTSSSYAQPYATEPRTEKAMGHYSRARALLVEALSEFDEGMQAANPDLLVNSEKWRLSVISRTEDLNKLLDPKPRVSRYGARFKASPLKVKRQKTEYNEPDNNNKPSEPYSVNYAGEENFYKTQHKNDGLEPKLSEQEELPQAMIEPNENASIKAPSTDPSKAEIIKPGITKETKSSDKPKLENFSATVVENATKAVPLQIEAQPKSKGPKTVTSEVKTMDAPKAKNSSKPSKAKASEESDISKAIESVIKNRFKELQKEGPALKK